MYEKKKRNRSEMIGPITFQIDQEKKNAYIHWVGISINIQKEAEVVF